MKKAVFSTLDLPDRGNFVAFCPAETVQISVVDQDPNPNWIHTSKNKEIRLDFLTKLHHLSSKLSLCAIICVLFKKNVFKKTCKNRRRFHIFCKLIMLLNVGKSSDQD